LPCSALSFLDKYSCNIISDSLGNTEFLIWKRFY
jgi:hypothetical protein